MELKFKESFKQDLKRIKNKKILQKVKELIDAIQSVSSLNNIQNIDIKKLRGHKSFYRIRLGNYRVGIKLEGNKITFIRILHRKDFYRYFP